MKDLGELKDFLGIEFARSEQGITMHQRKYALEVISKSRMSAARPAITPIDTNIKLTTKQYDEHIEVKDGVKASGDPLADQETYQRLIRKLLYLTVTRPDIAFAVQTLSQFLQQPKKTHMDAALRIVKYIKQSPGHGLLLSSIYTNSVTAYCDADWAACLLTGKSVTGYMVKVGNSVVSWKSKKQTTVSISSAESEYRSLATTVAELA
ncbi:uncharacterized mitochondrial protein AtMg00810-like [Lycium ferocissimum]|uniref:uncharacterized mitochondrial protein AtMg00810-like n=1 Tax=Lycium ferocissimum TaxID=112874 RepID=UPI00281619D5|nr:uncharacterized mitochondrial protein AtMg00810-like [Lycium ferocissimum]